MAAIRTTFGGYTTPITRASQAISLKGIVIANASIIAPTPSHKILYFSCSLRLRTATRVTTRNAMLNAVDSRATFRLDPSVSGIEEKSESYAKHIVNGSDTEDT